ncbi:hypothetical protein HMPREF9347_04860 [Escherichia coli MS 124-1]|nr:hypothetical protein HMPREF9347_04860 [Escherichia coli MS 124-1]
MKDILFSSGVGFWHWCFVYNRALAYSCTKCITRYIIHCVYVCRISGGEILYAMII